MTPLSDLESHKVNMPGLLTLSPPQSSLSHSLHSLRWLQGPQHPSWCLTVQFTFSWVHTHVLLQSIHLYCRSRIETFYKVCFAPNSRFISQICCFMIHMTRLDFPGKHRILPQKRSLENKLFKKKKKKRGQWWTHLRPQHVCHLSTELISLRNPCEKPKKNTFLTI